MALTGFEDHFLFIVFSNSHPMIKISEIELGKTLSLAKSI